MSYRTGKVKTGLVIMAAGNSERFGSNKLLADVEGLLMIERAFLSVPEGAFYRTAVVTQYIEVARLAEERGFEVFMNAHPEKGISETVRIGTAALSDADGIMFMAADQPWLKRATVEKLCRVFRNNPERICAPEHRGEVGNPCIFPRALFNELLLLEGDTGGKSVIKAHEDMLMTVEADADELRDADTPEDMFR